MTSLRLHHAYLLQVYHQPARSRATPGLWWIHLLPEEVQRHRVPLIYILAGDKKGDTYLQPYFECYDICSFYSTYPSKLEYIFHALAKYFGNNIEWFNFILSVIIDIELFIDYPAKHYSNWLNKTINTVEPKLSYNLLLQAMQSDCIACNSSQSLSSLINATSKF